ncbi:MAG: PP2C family protein-serine/threonine phosphatase [Actinomycetes bacterium]
MTAGPEPQGGWTRASSRMRGALTTLRRHVLPSEPFTLVALVVATAVIALLNVAQPVLVPVSMFVVVILVAGYLVGVRGLLVVYLAVAGGLVVVALRVPHANPSLPGSVLVLVVTGVIVLAVARVRVRLGVQGTLGESMLVDLRDRLAAQGELPRLPPGWRAEVVLRSAGGSSFSGDFLVAAKSPTGLMLEVVVVDVSGKGFAAGTRALLLSGAFGGLLGAMEPDAFLPAANAYLLRQEWSEGFATAVHLAIDLETGEYVVASAGHPPPAQFLSGSGQWRVLEGAVGTALGVLEDATFVAESGRLDRGDALLLYTDGLIEIPGRDISVGIDRLVGEAERLVTRGFRHGARRLIDAVATAYSDDRALLLLWRE